MLESTGILAVDVMIEKYDVVIVGAGSGGLKAAEILSKNKKQVLVLEKNKEIGYKVCAGGLTLNCLNMFPRKILQRKFKKLKIHSPLQTTEITNDKEFLATIDMANMHKYMAKQAINAGAEIRTNSLVTHIKKDFVILDGKKIRFNHLIGADGSNSIVRKSLGLRNEKILSAFQYIADKKFKDIEIFFDIDKFGVTYVWIFPYKKTVSIGTGGDLNENVKKFKSLLEVKKNFDEWCKDKFDIKKARFESATINYDYKGFCFKNKFLIGDAGGFASGLTGEGMHFAMLSGTDVANKIINKNYKCENIEHILKVKNHEEKILKVMETNKTITKIGIELITFLLKIKLINRNLIKYID